jgi:heme-degrading monooxygenase HmoA
VSVLMTLRMQADPKAIEGEDQALLSTIADRAKEHGLISHHFFGTDSEVLVVDEWPDEDSCRSFFDSSPDIGAMMARAGVTESPTPEFWHHLAVQDDVG